MRVHVALSPADFGGTDLVRATALVVDVLRATTTVVAACAAGCRRVVPAADAVTAERWRVTLAAEAPLLGGERGGDPIAGFDLGNSPLEYTTARVGGRTVVLTTTNGTAALLAASRAGGAAVAAFTNVSGAARWASEQGRDVTVLCSGHRGGVALEDVVCAGLLVGRLEADGDGEGRTQLSDAALVARHLADAYRERLTQIGEDATWARALRQAGRGDDVDACLRVDTTDEVPVLVDGSVLPGPAAAMLATRTPDRRAGWEGAR